MATSLTLGLAGLLRHRQPQGGASMARCSARATLRHAESGPAAEKFHLQHLMLLLKYTGIACISGAVNHGFFSGQRSLLTALAGIVLFVAGATVLVTALSIGAWQWLLQHPEWSATPGGHGHSHGHSHGDHGDSRGESHGHSHGASDTASPGASHGASTGPSHGHSHGPGQTADHKH